MDNNNNLLYIGAFFISVIIVSMVTDDLKAVYVYLVIVMLSVIFYNFNRYRVTITTPEILQ